MPPKLDHGVEDNEHGHGFGYGKAGVQKSRDKVECMMVRKTMSDMDYSQQSNILLPKVAQTLTLVT
jgi:hypothetical protein